ncbi:MAG: protein phosphatase 2C domain-containing protein [Deltaproteobacteria bacterium]|nr:protein phosphatase 2C domain-containing protein [Deltaproteobacteria bacterium]
MQIVSCGRTDIGKRRKSNQDAFFCDDELGFYIVADGMGGHAGGDVAAQEAVEAVRDMVSRGKDVIEHFRMSPVTKETSGAICRLMESAVQSATYMVYGMAAQLPGYHGMGTTVSALLLVGACGVTAQVGDTRIYCLRDGEVVQLTEDHTLLNWQIREGVISPEEAQHSPHRNIITRAVGNKDYVEVDTQVVSVTPGDRFLICSDGLHGYLRRGEIPDILGRVPDVACEELIRLANDRGGKDNVTAVVVQVLG